MPTRQETMPDMERRVGRLVGEAIPHLANPTKGTLTIYDNVLTQCRKLIERAKAENYKTKDIETAKGIIKLEETGIDGVNARAALIEKGATA